MSFFKEGDFQRKRKHELLIREKKDKSLPPKAFFFCVEPLEINMYVEGKKSWNELYTPRSNSWCYHDEGENL
jgi:hypothetical protein